MLLKNISLLALTLAGALYATAEDFTLKTETKPAPSEIAEAHRAELSDTVLQLSNAEGVLYEFWLRKEIPLKEKPASNDKALDAVEEMTFLGALVAHKEKRDYRDDELFEDTYTMRYAIQPQDGNHLGTSVYPYFAVLIAAKDDTAPDAFADAEAMIKVSSDNTAVGHPMILSLRPVTATEGEFPALKEPAEHHKSLRVKTTGKVSSSGETLDLILDIVYEGIGEI